GPGAGSAQPRGGDPGEGADAGAGGGAVDRGGGGDSEGRAQGLRPPGARWKGQAAALPLRGRADPGGAGRGGGRQPARGSGAGARKPRSGGADRRLGPGEAAGGEGGVVAAG